MEDELLFKCELKDGNQLFGIFDSHGGMWFVYYDRSVGFMVLS